MNIKKKNENEDNQLRLQWDLQDMNEKLDKLNIKIEDLVEKHLIDLNSGLNLVIKCDDQLLKTKMELNELGQTMERLKSRRTPTTPELELWIFQLSQLQKLSAILRQLYKLSKLMQTVSNVPLDGEEESLIVLIDKIEIQLNGSQLKELDVVIPMISYLNYRKDRAYKVAFQDIISGIKWSNSALISRGLNIIDKLDFVNQLIKELGQKQLLALRKLIKTFASNEQDFNDGLNDNINPKLATNREYWLKWDQALGS